jgi:deoxyribonuclease V
MRIRRLHGWEVTTEEARRLQESLAPRVRLEPLGFRPRYVAGADVSFERFGAEVFAAACVMDISNFSIIEEIAVRSRISFPYVPGLLSFREAPPVLEALEKLKCPADAVLLDGQGLAHPRFLGLACHIGLWVGIPTVGCAKSLLIGEYSEPGKERGATSPLKIDGRVVGAALRTREGAKPVFVSPGHMSDIAGACALVMSCTRGYRIPEPIRRSHALANTARREASK